MKAERDFWSRRRAGVEAERAAERACAEKAAAQDAQAALAERPEEDVLAELGLPVPEAVCSSEDVQKFMAKAVPEYLRRRALRTLWRSNPVLACLDGLNDYDGDFTNAATDAPGVKTAYRVGKGLQAHIDYLAAQKEARVAVVEEEVGDVEEPPMALVEEVVEVATPSVPEPQDDDIADTPRPRRMAFRFEGDAT